MSTQSHLFSALFHWLKLLTDEGWDRTGVSYFFHGYNRCTEPNFLSHPHQHVLTQSRHHRTPTSCFLHGWKKSSISELCTVLLPVTLTHRTFCFVIFISMYSKCYTLHRLQGPLVGMATVVLLSSHSVLVQRDSSAIKFDIVKTTFILALSNSLNH